MKKFLYVLTCLIVDILVCTLFIIPSIVLTILKIVDAWETWAFDYLESFKDE